MARLILNCDLGEEEPFELTGQLLDCVDAANIGCGFHAGSREKTRRTIERAVAANVLIGAHPGLPVDGGRGDVWPSVSQLLQLLEQQISFFQQAAQSLGAQTHYIKLHGTLYHAVEAEPPLAAAYIGFLKQTAPALAVFALAGGRFATAAQAHGLRVYHEAFADRAYRRDGSLLPRAQAHALLSEAESLQRFQQWRISGNMPTHDGGSLQLRADTLCVHADSPDALEMIRQLKDMR